MRSCSAETSGRGVKKGKHTSHLSDPVRLFWYQDFSGRLFKFRQSSEVRKLRCSIFELHKGFPLVCYRRGGSCRLLLKIRPQWSEILKRCLFRLVFVFLSEIPRRSGWSSPKRDTNTRPEIDVYFKFPTTAGILRRRQQLPRYQNRRTGSDRCEVCCPLTPPFARPDLTTESNADNKVPKKIRNMLTHRIN